MIPSNIRRMYPDPVRTQRSVGSLKSSIAQGEYDGLTEEMIHQILRRNAIDLYDELFPELSRFTREPEIEEAQNLIFALEPTVVRLQGLTSFTTKALLARESLGNSSGLETKAEILERCLYQCERLLYRIKDISSTPTERELALLRQPALTARTTLSAAVRAVGTLPNSETWWRKTLRNLANRGYDVVEVFRDVWRGRENSSRLRGDLEKLKQRESR